MIAVTTLGDNDLSHLKQKSLMFDQFYFTEDNFSPYRSLFPSHKPQLQAEIDYLSSKGLLAGPVTRESDPQLFETLLGESSRVLAQYLPYDSVAEQLYEEPELALIDWHPDAMVRVVTAAMNGVSPGSYMPAYRYAVPRIPASMDTSAETTKIDVMTVALNALPVPDKDCPWEAILDFREEMKDKHWGLQRWLKTLGPKMQTEAEVRDEIEWQVKEYTNALHIHKLKSSQSFLEVFIVTPIEILEDIAKFNWTKIAKGALAVNKRRVEMMEAEMKAPGRECAYIFEARKAFGAG